MGYLIIDSVEVKVDNFFEGNGSFSASGSGYIPDELVEFIDGKEISEYEAEFESGHKYPILGDYNFAKATTNGSEGSPEYLGFSIRLLKNSDVE